MSRPEVRWMYAVGSIRKPSHIFLEGSETPVCGTWAREWVPGGTGGRVHAECWRRCPWSPRLNAVMTDAQIAGEDLP